MRSIGFQSSELRDFGTQLLECALLQRFHAGNILFQRRGGNGAGFSEGCNLGHGLCAGAPAIFLAAAGEEWLQPQAAAEIEGADSLGGVYFMAADADHVSPECFGTEGYFEKSLYGIGMQQRFGACLFQHLGNGMDVRHGAGFIIDRHEGDQNSVIPERFLYGGNRNCSPGIGRKARHFPAGGLQQIQAFPYGIMLNLGGDDVVSGALHRFGALQKRPVIAFGSAGSEYQLRRSTAESIGNFFAACIKQFFGFPPFCVGGARVPVNLGHGVQGGFGCLGADSCGCGIIQIVFHKNLFFGLVWIL